MVKEIDRIVKGSELREMAEFLSDPSSNITDCFIGYQTEEDIGYKILGGSSLVTLIGLAQMINDQVSAKLSEGLDNDSGEQE